jgi:hypothetical protein
VREAGDDGQVEKGQIQLHGGSPTASTRRRSPRPTHRVDAPGRAATAAARDVRRAGRVARHRLVQLLCRADQFGRPGGVPPSRYGPLAARASTA